MSAEVVEYMSSEVHEYIITVVDFCSEIRMHRRTGVQTNTREQEYASTLIQVYTRTGVQPHTSSWKQVCIQE